MREYVEKLQAALRSARPHVYRQQHHGRHEQDRADAVAWISRYGTINASKQYECMCNCVKCTTERTRKGKKDARV